MSLPANSRFEIVDAGVDARSLAGGLVGFLLLMIVVAAGQRHAGGALIAIGTGFLGFALYMVIRIVAVARYANKLPAHVVKVWIERFRQPGYAGVRPRYRVRARVDGSDVRGDGAVCIYPFDSDNHFEDVRAAESVADGLMAGVVWHAPLSGIFMLREVKSQRWVTALACVIAGGAFLCVGIFRVAIA